MTQRGLRPSEAACSECGAQPVQACAFVEKDLELRWRVSHIRCTLGELGSCWSLRR